MMDILSHAFSALWQVALVAVVLGAGLPAVFALGIRSLDTGREVGTDGRLAPSSGGRVAAFLCFGVVIVAALMGIVVIVFGKQLFG